MNEKWGRMRGARIEQVDIWLCYEGRKDGAVVPSSRILDPGALGKSIDQAGRI